MEQFSTEAFDSTIIVNAFFRGKKYLEQKWEIQGVPFFGVSAIFTALGFLCKNRFFLILWYHIPEQG